MPVFDLGSLFVQNWERNKYLMMVDRLGTAGLTQGEIKLSQLLGQLASVPVT